MIILINKYSGLFSNKLNEAKQGLILRKDNFYDPKHHFNFYTYSIKFDIQRKSA